MAADRGVGVGAGNDNRLEELRAERKKKAKRPANRKASSVTMAKDRGVGFDSPVPAPSSSSAVVLREGVGVDDNNDGRVDQIDHGTTEAHRILSELIRASSVPCSSSVTMAADRGVGVGNDNTSSRDRPPAPRPALSVGPTSTSLTTAA